MLAPDGGAVPDGGRGRQLGSGCYIRAGGGSTGGEGYSEAGASVAAIPGHIGLESGGVVFNSTAKALSILGFGSANRCDSRKAAVAENFGRLLIIIMITFCFG